MIHSRLNSKSAQRFIALLHGAAILALSSAFPEGSAAAPPNIVFVLADDLGWSDIGCYGADLHETPNLDAFAKTGLKFNQAYAAAPVCTPTRASIMTGKYPARLHMTIWFEASDNPPKDKPLIPPATVGNLPFSETTLAEALREAGYATAHIGKWHLGDARHYPENQGFDLNVGGTLWGAPPTFFYPYRGGFGSRKEPRYVPRLEGGEPGEYLTDRLTDEAIRFIESSQKEPFFLHLAYHTVHTPIEAKQPRVEYFQKKLQPEFHHQNPTFAAMVWSLDENFGRLLSKIDELKLTGDTIVIFNSDNGGFINSHRDMEFVTNNAPLRSGKGSLYEGGIRAPLIIRWPGMTRPGTVCEEPVISTDFYPTLMEGVLERKEESDLDGKSLLELLRAPEQRMERESLFFHYPHYYQTTTPVSAVRQRDWKLLKYYETGKVELYHLADDLGEKKNLSKSNPAKAADLENLLDSWLREVNAQMPVRNEDRQPR